MHTWLAPNIWPMQKTHAAVLPKRTSSITRQHRIPIPGSNVDTNLQPAINNEGKNHQNSRKVSTYSAKPHSSPSFPRHLHHHQPFGQHGQLGASRPSQSSTPGSTTPHLTSSIFWTATSRQHGLHLSTYPAAWAALVHLPSSMGCTACT
jgi:hypothetical protein